LDDGSGVKPHHPARLVATPHYHYHSYRRSNDRTGDDSLNHSIKQFYSPLSAFRQDLNLLFPGEKGLYAESPTGFRRSD
jgi:hypothetical protein